MYKKEIPDQVGNDSSEDDKSGMTKKLLDPSRCSG